MQELLYKHFKDPEVQQRMQHRKLLLEAHWNKYLQKQSQRQANSTHLQVQSIVNDLVENTAARFESSNPLPPTRKIF